MASLRNRNYKIPRPGTNVGEVFSFILSEWHPKRKRICLTPICLKLGAESVAPSLFPLRWKYGFIIWRRPGDPSNYICVRFLPGTTWSNNDGTSPITVPGDGVAVN